MKNHWEVVVRGLHKHGGGPLPRAAFDEECETNHAATSGITMAREMGLVEVAGFASLARWTLTQLGRDWCDGRAVVVGGAWRRMAETADQRRRRIDKLLADADEAAEACARLTRRQREVLVLVAKGFTHRETAERLGLHVDSVHRHMERTLLVVGCTRSIEAAVLAGKAGLA